MNPSYILWAQLSLVGVGAFMQLIAFWAFSRDPDVHDGVQHGLAEGIHDHSHDANPLPGEPPPVSVHHPRADHTPQERFASLRSSGLTKTKRVNFKQDFKGLHH